MAEDAVLETDTRYRYASLSRRAAILSRSSSILNYQAFHLNRGFGRSSVRRQNTLRGLFIAQSRCVMNWLSIPTLRIWSTYYCYKGFNDKRLRTAYYSVYMFTDVSINYVSFSQPFITHLNFRIVQHLWVYNAVAKPTHKFSIPSIR